MRKFVKFTSVGLLITTLSATTAWAISAGSSGKMAISGLTAAECYDASNDRRTFTNSNNPNCQATMQLFACYPKPAGCVCDAVVTSASVDCDGVGMWGPWY